MKNQQENFQLSHSKVYKVIKQHHNCQSNLEEYDIKIDQGKRKLPKVWNTDNMTTDAQEDNKNKRNKSFYPNSKYDKLREKRAKIILSKEKPILKIKNGLYFVQSQSGTSGYKVQWNGKHWICNCLDFAKNGSMGPCKHIITLKLYLDGYIIIEGQLKITPVTYKQDWKNYNAAQSREIELFDQFLYQLVSTIDELEQHMGRPRLRLQDQIFCCVMKVYSQLSLRRAKCLYEQALQRQQITHAPRYNVVSDTLLKPEVTQILINLVHLSAQPLASVETDFAIDSSGFRCSSFGNYCEEKHGTKRTRNWLKVHICTGVNTNIVADIIITDEHGADSPQFKKLMLNTSKFFNIKEVSADLAYSSRKNLEIVDKLGGIPYIPFKKNTRGMAKGSALWRKTFHYFQLHREEFMEHYHKRSNAESTFAAIKNKFGENIKSRKRVAQVNEMLCKIIAYNITVLIHEMVSLSDNSDILIFAGLMKEQD